jgi:hypothetical protein
MLQALARAVRAFSVPPRINLQTRVSSTDEKKDEKTGSGSGFTVTGGIPDIDYLDELGFPAYLEAFRRLENDPQIAKELRGNTAPLIAADWQMEPASDAPRDVLISEFVGANLYQQESDHFGTEFWCRTDWTDHLRDALRMLVNGFSICQMVYRKQGRFQVLDCAKYLQPESIRRWFFDKADNLVKIERYYIGADGEPVSNEFIPADQLFIYTWDQEGSNILGRPLIRAMWGSFQLKTRFRKLAAIGTMKTAVAVPYFENPVGASDRDITRGEQLAKQMRSGNLERVYAAITTGQKIGWAEATGDGTKGIPELIQMENGEIAAVGGLEFTGLGTDGQAGSRGVAGTQASFSSLLLSAIARYIVARQRIRIRAIVDANFPGVTRHPRMKVDNIDPFQKTRILPDIVTAIGAKAITNTIDTENELRRRWGLMEITEDERAQAQVTEPSSTATPAGQGAPQGQEQTNPGAVEGSTPGEEPGAGAATNPATMSRHDLADASLIERHRVDAGAILRELEKHEAVYYAALSHVEADMRDAVIGMVRSGTLRPTKASDVKVPFQEDLRARLVSILKGVRDYGRNEIVNEIRRQSIRIAAGRIVKSNPATRRGAMAVSNQQAQVTADLDVTNLVARLQSQTVGIYHDLAAQGANDEEIAAGLKDYLAGITDKQIAQMARSSTSVAFNGGRAVSILEHKEQLQPVATRVEVGDENSCDPCATPASQGGLNGLRVEIGSKSWLQAQPPNGCDGGDRCRGFMVVEVMP